MRFFAISFSALFLGCSDKNLKSQIVSPTTTTTTEPLSSSWSVGPTMTPSQEDDIEPELLETPIPSLHVGFTDLSEYSSFNWYDELCRNLEQGHRGDWTTWIGFGGPSMVDFVSRRLLLSSGKKGLFVLAAELVSRPVPPESDPMNVTQALGNTCDQFDEFVNEALRKPRITQDGIRSEPTLVGMNPHRAKLEIAPFANINLVCLSAANSIEFQQMVLNHKIGRRLIDLANRVANELTDREYYRTRTDTNLAAHLRWISSMTVTRFSMGFRVTYEDDSAIGDGVYRDWIVKIMRQILNYVNCLKLMMLASISHFWTRNLIWKRCGNGKVLVDYWH